MLFWCAVVGAGDG